RRGGDGAWHGLVAPLDDRFTLWLSIFRGPDGGLLAAFRNPEENSNGGASRFALTRDGDHLHFGFRYVGGAVDRDATLLHDPDPFFACRLSRPTNARGIFLRPRPPDAARPALGRQDLRLGDARRGDAARHSNLARDANHDPARRARPVRQSRSAQGPDHAGP